MDFLSLIFICIFYNMIIWFIWICKFIIVMYIFMIFFSLFCVFIDISNIFLSFFLLFWGCNIVVWYFWFILLMRLALSPIYLFCLFISFRVKDGFLDHISESVNFVESWMIRFIINCGVVFCSFFPGKQRFQFWHFLKFICFFIKKV